METINKKALIDLVSERTNITKKDATEIVDAVFNTVKDELASGKTVDIAGFGKFSVKESAARSGVNPATGEKIEIAASNRVVFKVSKTLKDCVNN